MNKLKRILNEIKMALFRNKYVLKQTQMLCTPKRVNLHWCSNYGVPNIGDELSPFDKVKELVLKASYMVPHFRMVAWDVSVLEDGTPVLIEANLYDGQLDSHQIHNGPLFKKDTERILDEVFGK